MGGNGEQPGGKGTLDVIAGQVLVGLEEGLLSRVFGGFGFTEHPITQVVDRFLVRLDQVGKGFIIAFSGLEYPGLFVSHCGSSLIVLK